MADEPEEQITREDEDFDPTTPAKEDTGSKKIKLGQVDVSKVPGYFRYVDKDGGVFAVKPSRGGKKLSPEEVRKRENARKELAEAKDIARKRISKLNSDYKDAVKRENLDKAQSILDQRKEAEAEYEALKKKSWKDFT